jgi:2'-5' RNA ligase
MNPNADASKGDDSKRLFFGAQVDAPWPKDFPKARMIDEQARHITLAFIGQDSFSKFKPLLSAVPTPLFPIGPIGIADKLVFLPPDKSRVAALSVKWLNTPAMLNDYQKTLCDWLKAQDYSLDKRPFFPHITVARSPFDQKEWLEHFTPLPFFVKAIHLYQSLGSLQYQSLWELPLLAPFEEFEHTADIAFLVRGANLQELYLNAQMALAFKFPPLVDFFSSKLQDSLDEIIISLNEIVGTADAQFGCPFKAISFHGNIKKDAHNILLWEMIVDV